MFVMKKRYLIFLLAFIFVISLALSSTLKIWEQKGKKELEKGEVISVSITHEGNIILPPTLQELYATSEPYLWCLAIDNKGNIYAGSGTEGKVFLIDANGQGRLFFDSDELQVNSIAVDGAGNVIVATLPNGSIYKITSGGQVTKLFTPKARYIWCLGIDSGGNIYAGTGTDGIIFKIDQKGQSEELFNSEETHIKCLSLDNEGNIIAGSEPNGHIYRISPEGKVYVLYDSPLQEISSIKIDAQGNIYAAAISKDAAKKNINTEQEESAPEDSEPPEPTTANENSKENSKEKSAIYKISRDYSVEKIWSSSSAIAHSLELDRDGNVIVGTGDKGLLYSLSPGGEETILLKCSEKQVTALKSDNRNSIYLTSSNVGKIFKLSFIHPNRGFYQSKAKDTQTVSQWGMLTWYATLKQNTDLRIYTRTGNTAKPDNTWSQWSPAYQNAQGSLISSPTARYIQWKAELISNNLSDTPILHKISIAYLQKNIKPKITEIKIYPSGIYFKGPIAIDEDKELNMPEDFQSFVDDKKEAKNNQIESSGKKSYKKGVQFFSWNAEDENADQLTFSLYYKASDENKWKELKSDIEDSFYLWDVTAVPDGIYRVKVEAYDQPSNPEKFALKGSEISEPFNIDNTPPRISNILVNKIADGIKITFSAQDEFSFIRRASYSVDGAPWEIIYSRDGILDSPKEDFEIILKGSKPGEHTVVLKVEDSLYNITTDKAIIQ
jgi:hypothetical protein